MESLDQIAKRVAQRKVSELLYDAPIHWMNPPQEEMWDTIMTIATNDGGSYAKRDAIGAIQKAWREWQTLKSQRMRADFKQLQKHLIQALTKIWEGE